MGPMVSTAEVEVYVKALEIIKEQGGEIVYGGNVLTGDKFKSGCYVEPTIVKNKPDMPIVQEETFAPILYVMPFKELDEAIDIHNDVVQGLSSAMFTTNLLSAET